MSIDNTSTQRQCGLAVRSITGNRLLVLVTATAWLASFYPNERTPELSEGEQAPNKSSITFLAAPSSRKTLFFFHPSTLFFCSILVFFYPRYPLDQKLPPSFRSTNRSLLLRCFIMASAFNITCLISTRNR